MLDRLVTGFQPMCRASPCTAFSADSWNEPECFGITLAVLAEAAFCSGWARQQRITFVEPNRINGEADLLCDDQFASAWLLSEKLHP